MQGLKNLPEVGPGGQVLEAPTCCQRAPPCVRAPPRPTPDWAFWHLCVCTLHSTQPPGAGPGCKTGPGTGTCASSAHYKSCHSGREAPDPRGWSFRVGLSSGRVRLPSLWEGCVQTSWTTPPLAQAFQLLSIHRGQILKLQQDSHLPLALTLPQQTTSAPLNSLRLTRKTNPKVLSEFSACGAS